MAINFKLASKTAKLAEVYIDNAIDVAKHRCAADRDATIAEINRNGFNRWIEATKDSHDLINSISDDEALFQHFQEVWGKRIPKSMLQAKASVKASEDKVIEDLASQIIAE